MAFSGAGSAVFTWIVPPAGIIDNIHKMRRRTIRKGQERFEDFAEEVQEWMKDNHPWQNRTYTAEDSLTAQVHVDGDEMQMDIGYDLAILQTHPDGRGRDYSIYLEGYLNLGIIQPTMDHKAPEAMDRFEGIMTF